MKKALMLVLASMLVAPAAYAVDIAVVKTVDDNCYPVYFGMYVTVQGLAMSGDELGSAGPAYIEDPTGGVAYYEYPVGIQTGDFVEISAWIDFYAGLIELADDPVTGEPPVVTILSSGNPVVPHVITIPDLGEFWEGSLGKFECVFFPEADGIVVFTGSHDFEDAFGNVGTLYTDSSTDVRGSIIPQGWLNITGCLGQYDNESPYCEFYQVIPRSMADFEYSPSATDDVSWSGVKALYR
ncbi:MAG: hypothetical protein KAW17_02820 [Candidatus Eisenbacteria sp.]|nr:hypothetical protein [Candidatus Eisenbacteria bacterium]